MNVEDRLSRALGEEASRRDVDVTGLWAHTRRRLVEERPPRRARVIVLAAAAVSVVVGVGGLGVAAMDRLGLVDVGVPLAGSGPSEGGVADSFLCEDTFTYPWHRPGYVEDYLVVSLDGGPDAEAERQSAARYEFDQRDDRAVLRLGDQEGRLLMVSEFRRRDGAWEPVRTEVCTGSEGSIAVPTENEWTLGPHDAEPYPAGPLVGEDGGPVLLDDRSYYDGSGRTRHRSFYAAACGDRLCLAAGEPTSMVVDDLEYGLKPYDARSMFFPPDELVERTHPYGLWLLYDTEDLVLRVAAELEDDTRVKAQIFRSPKWDGRLFALLAPYEEVRAVTVERATASEPGPSGSGTYRPEELPGYDGG